MPQIWRRISWTVLVEALFTMPEFQASDGEDTAESWGEPIKVEASSPLPNSKVSGSPTLSPITPVNLELPVKLMRLDHSPVQMTQYEDEEEEQNEEQEPSDSPDQETSFTPEWMFSHGSSDMDVWNGLAEWNPWVAMKMEMSYAGEQFEGSHPAEQISQGSALHGTGACKPCAWFWKPGSCQNKDNCSYCHLCPEGSCINFALATASMSHLAEPGELKARKKAKASLCEMRDDKTTKSLRSLYVVAMMRLGVITPKTAKEHPETVLNLSSLLLYYHTNPEEFEGSRVVGFEVWIPSTIRWASRWDNYLKMHEGQIHWPKSKTALKGTLEVFCGLQILVLSM
eukprot:Skav232044  [mRNA]  locus=scaffold6250:15624:28972:+ [translate_table: standard]